MLLKLYTDCVNIIIVVVAIAVATTAAATEICCITLVDAPLQYSVYVLLYYLVYCVCLS